MNQNLKKFMRFSFVGIKIIFFTLILLSVILAVTIFKGLPNVEKLVESYSPSVPTTLYDSNEKVIDLVSKEMREIATLDEVPLNARNAFIAIEDKRFYSHHGLDPIRLGKAFLVNISERRAAQGGSTITQQLAKNAFLTHEKSITRKLKEAMITMEIERKYTKNEILEKYLNEIYFGSGYYGIKTAAKSLFGKDVPQLNLAESAMLAGIPNRPSYYSPKNHLDNAVKRSHLVLRQMLKENFITQEEYDTALKHEFIYDKDLKKKKISDKNTTVVRTKNIKDYLNTPDFSDIVEKKLFELFDEDLIFQGGLKVYTSLDLEMQKIALDTFNQYQPFKNNPDLQGALITIDSSNGYVKSIVGGKNFKDGNFNRAIWAKRQPGSSFKPFVYYTALEKGIPMNRVINDSIVKYENYDDWEPGNYNNQYLGNLTLIEAMERSVNTVAIKLMDEIGVSNVIKTFDKTGVNVKIPKYLSSALGTMSMSPYELATAYAPFSNGGYKVKPIFITKVVDRYGNIIYEDPIEKQKIFDSVNVSLIVHMMKSVVNYGSGRGARVRDRSGNVIEQGGKTGTTNDYKSAWYVGITPQYVTTVYIGHDNNKSMSRRMTGGGVAAPLWGQYYQNMLNKGVYTPEQFEFMEDHIKNGDLISRSIDSRTGSLDDNTSGFTRTALFKKGQVPAQSIDYSEEDEGFNFFGGFFQFKKNEEEQDFPEEQEEELNIENEADFSDSIFDELINPN